MISGSPNSWPSSMECVVKSWAPTRVCR